MDYVSRLGATAFITASFVLAEASSGAGLQISPRLDVEYDSNVARASDEVAATRNIEQSDIRYSPGILFSGEIGSGRQSLFANADFGYDFYQRNEQLNSERLLLDAGSRLQISRCTVSTLASFSRRQSDLADLIDLERVENIQTTTQVSLDGRCGGPVGFVPTAGVSRTWTRNSDDLRQYGNSTSTTVRGGIAYMRPSFGELSLSGRYTRVTYPDETLLGEELSDGYESYSAGVRYERRIGSRLGGSVGLFHTSVDPGDGGEKFSGLTADAIVDVVLSGSTRASFSAARDVRPANLLGGDYVVASSYAARLEHALGPRLVVHARGALENQDVKGEILSSLPILRSERRYSASTGVSFRYTDRATAALELAHSRRNAEPSIFNYSSTRALLSLRYSLGRRN